MSLVSAAFAAAVFVFFAAAARAGVVAAHFGAGADWLGLGHSLGRRRDHVACFLAGFRRGSGGAAGSCHGAARAKSID